MLLDISTARHPGLRGVLVKQVDCTQKGKAPCAGPGQKLKSPVWPVLHSPLALGSFLQVMVRLHFVQLGQLLVAPPAPLYLEKQSLVG